MKIFRYFTNVCQWMEDFLDSNSEHSFFFHPGTSWSHLVFSVLLLSPAVWSHCTVHQWLPGLHGYEERSSASGLHLLLPLQTDQPGCCMCDHLSVDLLMFFFLFSFDFYFTLYVIHWIVLLFLFNWCCFLGSVCPSLCLWSVTDCQSIRLMFLWSLSTKITAVDFIISCLCAGHPTDVDQRLQGHRLWRRGCGGTVERSHQEERGRIFQHLPSFG